MRMKLMLVAKIEEIESQKRLENKTPEMVMFVLFLSHCFCKYHLTYRMNLSKKAKLMTAELRS